MLPVERSASKSGEFCKKYKCKHVKAPRLVSQVEHLPLQGYLLSKGKSSTKRRQVTTGERLKPLQISVDGPTRSDADVPSETTALSPTRVAPCKFREHFYVSKRLKKLSSPKVEGVKKYQAFAIVSSSKEDVLSNPFLQEYNQIKEERHFHIGRVIKYLTD